MQAQEIIEGTVLAVGGLGTGSGILLNWKGRRLSDTKVTAEIGIDDATKASIIQGAASSVEQDYLNRLTEFRAEITRLTREVNHERERAGEWRDRVMLLEDFFFTQHMPWVRRMTLVAQEHHWEVEEPPSILKYLKEVQDMIKATQTLADER